MKRMSDAGISSMSPDAGPIGSVYGELKLSEKLSSELQVVRDQVEHLRESLEEALYLKEKHKSELE